MQKNIGHSLKRKYMNLIWNTLLYIAIYVKSLHLKQANLFKFASVTEH